VRYSIVLSYLALEWKNSQRRDCGVWILKEFEFCVNPPPIHWTTLGMTMNSLAKKTIPYVTIITVGLLDDYPTIPWRCYFRVSSEDDTSL